MIVTDIIFAIPIGILYTIISNKLADVLTEEENYNDKIQDKLLILIVMGIVALVMATLLFSRHQKLHNRMVRYGLYVGTSILWFMSIIGNWKLLSDDIKDRKSVV